MKIFNLILLLIIICLTSYGQAVKDSTIPPKKNQEFHLVFDTIKVQTLKSSEKTKLWYENNNMPWIISLIISFMTIGINIYIAKVTHKTAIKSVEAQITSSTITSKSQIESSQQIAIQEIQNSQDLALTQFKMTLNTKNRQDWINELRHSISEFLAQSAMINVLMTAPSEEREFKDFQPFFEKIIYHHNKIEILLNQEKVEQKAVLKLIREMRAISLQPEKDYNAKKFRIKENEIFEASRNLFRIHWQKIKEI